MMKFIVNFKPSIWIGVMGLVFFVGFLPEKSIQGDQNNRFLQWPQLEGNKAVHKGQFETYIEMRQTDEKGVKFWTLYLSKLNESAIKITTDRDPIFGFSKKIFQFNAGKGKYVLSVEVDSVKFLPLSPGEEIKITAIDVAVTERYFVYEYLLFTDVNSAYDLKKLMIDAGDETAKLTYDQIPRDVMTQDMATQIKLNCFSNDVYCSQNFDDNGLSITVDNGIFQLDNVSYCVQCGSEGPAENERCYYYLLDLTNGETFYFPQDLVVSNSELPGIRTMLVPLIEPTDKFFADLNAARSAKLVNASPAFNPSSVLSGIFQMMALAIVRNN